MNSVAKTVNKLATPTVGVLGGKLDWTQVPNAKNYIIEVNGNKYYRVTRTIGKKE